MNETQARSLPTIRGLQDEKAHRDRTFALGRERLESEKDFAERSLKRRKKDARTGAILGGAKVGADLGLGVLGAMDSGNDAVVPELTDSLPEVPTELSFQWDEPVKEEGLSFYMGDDPLKKWAGEAAAGVGDLYNSVADDLFDFNMDDFDIDW
jgi:hypothetical protein